MILSSLPNTGTWHASVRDAIALEIEELAVRTARLGEELCDDPVVVARHMVSLQEIDRITQMLTCLAAMLRADDVGAAMGDLPIRELAERLEERIGSRHRARG